MFEGRQIAVVIPCYRVTRHILDVLAGLPALVDRIYCIDDACPDGSGTLVEARCGDPRVRVIRHAENQGVGGAMLTGYAAAAADGVDVIVKMDGDGQMDPDLIELFLRPIAEGRADYAKGNRFRTPGVWRAMPRARLAGNIALSLATRLTSGYWHLFDSQCGYTAASRRALEVIDRSGMFPRYGYPNDVLARLNAAGLAVEDVPVRAVYGPRWRSGIRPHMVVYPISFVLLRSWVWRLLQPRPSADTFASAARNERDEQCASAS